VLVLCYWYWQNNTVKGYCRLRLVSSFGKLGICGLSWLAWLFVTSRVIIVKFVLVKYGNSWQFCRIELIVLPFVQLVRSRVTLCWCQITACLTMSMIRRSARRTARGTTRRWLRASTAECFSAASPCCSRAASIVSMESSLSAVLIAHQLPPVSKLFSLQLDLACSANLPTGLYILLAIYLFLF